MGCAVLSRYKPPCSIFSRTNNPQVAFIGAKYLKGTCTTFFKSFSPRRRSKKFCLTELLKCLLVMLSSLKESKSKHPKLLICKKTELQEVEVYLSAIVRRKISWMWCLGPFWWACNGGIHLEQKNRLIGPMGRFVSHRRTFECNEWRVHSCRSQYIQFCCQVL